MYRELWNRENQASRVGGFPKSERAIRGTPEALRVLRGCADAWMRSCAEELVQQRGRDCRRGLILDCFIVLWCIDCNVKYIYANINAVSQEVFSTSANCSVCCMVMFIC